MQPGPEPPNLPESLGPDNSEKTIAFVHTDSRPAPLCQPARQDDPVEHTPQPPFGAHSVCEGCAPDPCYRLGGRGWGSGAVGADGETCS